MHSTIFLGTLKTFNIQNTWHEYKHNIFAVILKSNDIICDVPYQNQFYVAKYKKWASKWLLKSQRSGFKFTKNYKYISIIYEIINKTRFGNSNKNIVKCWENDLQSLNLIDKWFK